MPTPSAGNAYAVCAIASTRSPSFDPNRLYTARVVVPTSRPADGAPSDAELADPLRRGSEVGNGLREVMTALSHLGMGRAAKRTGAV